jgi:NADH dehydrogenase FAD-containing subunit
MGVEIHVGTMVTSVDQLGVDTNAKESHLRRIEAATKIWAAGVEASPLGRILARAPGVELDRTGRVEVEPDCTLPGHAAVLGRLHVSGFPAWVLWLLIHLMTLTGFKNRISVAFNWTVAFLGRGRPERVITAQQVFARHALEAHAGEHGTVPPIATTVAAKAQGPSALPETSA